MELFSQYLAKLLPKCNCTFIGALHCYCSLPVSWIPLKCLIYSKTVFFRNLHPAGGRLRLRDRRGHWQRPRLLRDRQLSRRIRAGRKTADQVHERHLERRISRLHPWVIELYYNVLNYWRHSHLKITHFLIWFIICFN